MSTPPSLPFVSAPLAKGLTGMFYDYVNPETRQEGNQLFSMFQGFVESKLCFCHIAEEVISR